MQQNFTADYFRPRELEVESLGPNLSKIVLGPFERGVGYTLGNSLRRIMLSSLPGLAVTEIMIDGVLHEYSSINGVKEDVVDLLLNIKGLVFTTNTELVDPKVKLEVSRSGVVTGADLKLPVGVELLNPPHILAHLSEGARLSFTLIIERGVGYRPVLPGGVGQHVSSGGVELGSGKLLLDAYFTPVLKVSYSVEPMRVGQRTDLDRLSLVVHTDGSLSPEAAVVAASSCAVDQFSLFSALGGSQSERPFPVFAVPADTQAVSLTSQTDSYKAMMDVAQDDSLLRMSVDELDLTSRASNCLKADRIFFVSDLVKKTEQELLRMPNLGRKSLNEIKEALSKRGLSLA
jgi:DNA-directed RNA polymerase subunit alpha